MFKRLYNNSRNLLTKEHSNILSAALVIMFTVFLSGILGIIRNRLLISFFYDRPEVLDAYWAAFRLPDMLFQILVVGALSAAFIPVFSRYVDKNKQKEANIIASSTINLVIIALVLISLVVAFFAEPLSRLIASGFSDFQIHLMAKLTRIMIFAQILFGFSSFLTGVIQSHKRFLIPALSPLLYNLGIILGTVFLSKPLGIFGPAFGVVLGALLHLSSQLPLASKLGFKYSFKWSFNHPAVKEIKKLMLPRTLALSVGQIEQTAIVFFATALPSGNLTMVYIAQQLANMPVRIFGIPIGQASLPFFSKVSAKNDLKKLARMVNTSLLEILYLALPASVIVLVLRIPLVRLAYGAKQFPWTATVTTGKLVAILALSIVARSLTHLLVRVFYSLRNTKTPLIIAIFTATLSVGLSYFFIFTLQTGILGLAVAVTIASLIESILLVTCLFAKAQFQLKNIITPTIKMLLASLITTLALWIPLRLLDQLIFDTTRTIPLIMLTITVFAIGLSIYIGVSYLLKIHELRIFIKLAHRIGNWRKVLDQTTETLETTETTL